MAERTSSGVHPKYKTKYREKNWREYEQGLRDRGDVTIWFSDAAAAKWVPRGKRQRGEQREYSDLAIETALTLRMLFRLALRQTEGFVGSLFHRYWRFLLPSTGLLQALRSYANDIAACLLFSGVPIGLSASSKARGLVADRDSLRRAAPS